MKKFIQLSMALLTILLVTFSCTQNPVDPIKDRGVQNSTYIVVLNQDGNSIQSSNINSKIKALFTKHNIDLNSLKYTYNTVLYGLAAKLTESQLTSLRLDKLIKYIQKDQLITLGDDVEYIIQKGKPPPPNQPPTTNWGVQNVGSTSSSTSSGVAWVVDTGIDLDHDGLNVNTNLDYDFVNNDDVADDDNGHGSHCAGIIGYKNTDYTIGVCPNAALVAIKVLNSSGSGYTSVIIAGLDYIGTKLNLFGLNVVNISLGGSLDQALDDAVTALAGKGAYICIAAGNSKKNASNYSPSRVNGDRIFTISAHDESNKFASFSNYGIPPVDFSAPGVTIFSCYKDGGYAWMSGTSMSAPHCCGILLATNGYINQSGTIYCSRDHNNYPKAHL